MTDHAALELCLQQVLDSGDALRVQQVRSFLDGDGPHLPPRPWREVAEFCAYIRQAQTLGLAPHESVPCWGDGSTNAPHDRLHRRLVKAGISPFHSDPIAALEAAGLKPTPRGVN